jgi:hypothetical protein
MTCHGLLAQGRSRVDHLSSDYDDMCSTSLSIVSLGGVKGKPLNLAGSTAR